MPFLRSTLGAIAVLAIQAIPSSAQTLSVDEILAQVEKKVSSQNGYQKLLNDPDPQRSMAAMEVMLGSGDVGIQRMALDFGLYSPNPVVQRTALDAFFASQPVINIQLTQANGDNNGDWGAFTQNAGGSVLNDGRAFIPLKIGEFDPSAACYVNHRRTDECLVRISDHGTAVALWGKWHSVQLNDQGQLVGSGAFPNSNKPVQTMIQVGH